ncbi:hypothetical protein EV363DRAFT_1414843 [Boletus edulis]|nr:hypothetical protein EV363DRAFT_1414843 [Boletus edulis]
MPPQRRIYIVRFPFQRRHLRVYTPTQFQLYSSSLRVVTKSCERSKSVVAQPAHTEMRACPLHGDRSLEFLRYSAKWPLPPTDSPAWEGRRYLERDTFDVFSLDDYTTDAPYPRYAFRKSWALVQRPHPMIGVPPAWTAFLDQKCRTALGYRFVNGWNLEQPVNAQVLQTFSHPIPVHVLSLQAIPMRAKARMLFSDGTEDVWQWQYYIDSRVAIIPVPGSLIIHRTVQIHFGRRCLTRKDHPDLVSLARTSRAFEEPILEALRE